ncbi:unnamed protein product [Pleuronectes platessa]|uniref:Uncharacterized protein n=1 Tax=Pleuronectes platessa TaxID=8262 RepID=A0A9N7YGT1_PLEPL|nr:unnamed protein product [Pleuronectes platessa]
MAACTLSQEEVSPVQLGAALTCPLHSKHHVCTRTSVTLTKPKFDTERLKKKKQTSLLSCTATEQVRGKKESVTLTEREFSVSRKQVDRKALSNKASDEVIQPDRKAHVGRCREETVISGSNLGATGNGLSAGAVRTQPMISPAAASSGQSWESHQKATGGF